MLIALGLIGTALGGFVALAAIPGLRRSAKQLLFWVGFLGLTALLLIGVADYGYQVYKLMHPAPYPAALLDCYPDARIYQHRTVMQTTVPSDVLYVARDWSQEISRGEASGYNQYGSAIQLFGVFIQCSLRNTGDHQLSEVRLAFKYAFSPGFTVSDVSLSGKPMPKGQYRTVMTFPPQHRPFSVTAVAQTSTLDPGKKFDFAVANADQGYDGFLGFPTSDRSPIVLPILSYRLRPDEKAADNRSLTLTCRAKVSLIIPVYPAQKATKAASTIRDKCIHLFFGAFNIAEKIALKVLLSLPPECRDYHKLLAMYGAATDSCND